MSMPYIFNQTELCELGIISHLISCALQKPGDNDTDGDESDKDEGGDGDDDSGGGNDSDDVAVAASDCDDNYKVFQLKVTGCNGPI